MSSPVPNIAAEGAAGLPKRVRAWQTERGLTRVDGIYFLTEPVNFLEADDVERLQQTIAAMPEPPRLIVIDTMARCMVGGDENSVRDVGLFIAAVDALRAP